MKMTKRRLPPLREITFVPEHLDHGFEIIFDTDYVMFLPGDRFIVPATSIRALRAAKVPFIDLSEGRNGRVRTV